MWLRRSLRTIRGGGYQQTCPEQMVRPCYQCVNQFPRCLSNIVMHLPCFRHHDRLGFRRWCLRPPRPFLDVRLLFFNLPSPTQKHSTNTTLSFGNNHLRAVWRLSLGLGVVPAVLVFIWRLKMVEPTRFRRDSMKRVKIPYLLIIRRYWVSLAAICLTWYVLRS